MPVDPQKELKKFDKAEGDRLLWEHHWQEIADLVVPTRNFTFKFEPGEERRNQIFDATASTSAVELAAAMQSLLTNPAIKWFALKAADEDLNAVPDVRVYLEDATNRMLGLFANPASGFATAISETYLDDVAFGTSVLVVRSGPLGVRFQAQPLPEIYLQTDDEGTFTDLWRLFELPAHEVVANWGDVASDPNNPGRGPSKRVMDMANDPKRADHDIEIIHHVFVRDDRDPQRQDGPNKPIGSVYIERDGEQLISERGFDENPYLPARWSKAPGEIYGRSPAMTLLPDIKTLNAMTRTLLIAGEMATNAPILVPANGIEGPVRTAPGSLIYYRRDVRELPRRLEHGRVDIGEALVDKMRDGIKRGFFLDLFRLPESDRMTATEILERRNQALLTFSPILARQYQEKISPLVIRTFNALRRRRLLPMEPPVLQGRALDIQYVSPMAMSQRSSELTNFLQFMNTAAPLLNLDPSTAQNLDQDVAFRYLGEVSNVTERMFRPLEDVRRMRAQVAAAQQAQQQAALAQGVATAGRDAAAGIKDIADVGGG